MIDPKEFPFPSQKWHWEQSLNSLYQALLYISIYKSMGFYAEECEGNQKIIQAEALLNEAIEWMLYGDK